MANLISGALTVGQSISGTDDAFVLPGASIDSVGNAITFSLVGEGFLSVSGTLVATLDGIRTNGNDTVIVTQTGVVMGFGGQTSDGIRIMSSGNSATIAGFVRGDDFGLVSVDFGNNELTITSTGVVQGGSDSNGTDNEGAEDSFSAAIGALSGTFDLVNNGQILAELNPTTGERLAVINAGFDALNSFVGPFDLEDRAILRFVNSGFVQGDVLFFGGGDLYDGRGGGFVDGVIDMGRGDDVFFGGDLADLSIGDRGNDLMIDAGGNDTMFGDEGNDTMKGGDGDDEMSGGDDNDIMNGGAGDDTMQGGDGRDVIRAKDGDDQIEGGLGGDVLFGGFGSDLFIYTAQADSTSGANADKIRGFESGLDTIDISAVTAGTATFVGNGAFVGGGVSSVRTTLAANGNLSVRIDADGDGSQDMQILLVDTAVVEASDFIL